MTNPKPKDADGYALRVSRPIDEIFNLTKIDRWFLTQIVPKGFVNSSIETT